MRLGIAVDPQAASRTDLAAGFAAVRNRTRELCAPLSAEDQMVQSMADASPAKWHQAHTTWFFETFLLLPHLRGYQPLDSRYTFLFNSYYKQLGGHPVRAQRGLWSRPTLEDVLRYRKHVDEQMVRLLENDIATEVAATLELGLNHEEQHQELIVTDIKHGLWTNPLRPAYREKPAINSSSTTSPLRWISYDGGLHSVGHAGDSFSFDNETPRHQVFLQPFRLASRLVTNAEYLDFMNDGGYSRPELWLSEGWDTVNAQDWHAPLYWQMHDGEWSVYTLNGQRSVNLAEPVCHVSYFEADAYARWAGARLATEFEWEVAASVLDAKRGTGLQVASDPGVANLLDSGRLHPAALDAAHADENFGDPQQLFGDTWEWTASQYTAYPGFRPAAGVVGEYNGKFMCNQFVLRGGSCATPADHIRSTYRNFFPPHVRWQFSGIRLAQ